MRIMLLEENGQKYFKFAFQRRRKKTLNEKIQLYLNLYLYRLNIFMLIVFRISKKFNTHKTWVDETDVLACVQKRYASKPKKGPNIQSIICTESTSSRIIAHIQSEPESKRQIHRPCFSTRSSRHQSKNNLSVFVFLEFDTNWTLNTHILN